MKITIVPYIKKLNSFKEDKEDFVSMDSRNSDIPFRLIALTDNEFLGGNNNTLSRVESGFKP
ncbi:hypothetical protein J2T13_003537 [Paenibacillus sp. DS2015]|uniref:hypothetical protein n=1 Tax=Paenibacillus sp. DS2015 TaxID=3373917 RepID=UPI003D24FBA7